MNDAERLMELAGMQGEEFEDVVEKVYALAASHIDVDAVSRERPGAIARHFALSGFIEGIMFTLRCFREGRADDLSSILLNRDDETHSP